MIKLTYSKLQQYVKLYEYMNSFLADPTGLNNL